MIYKHNTYNIYSIKKCKYEYLQKSKVSAIGTYTHIQEDFMDVLVYYYVVVSSYLVCTYCYCCYYYDFKKTIRIYKHEEAHRTSSPFNYNYYN